MANQKVVYSFIASDKFSAVARKVGAITDKVGRKFKGLGKSIEKTGNKIKNLGGKARAFSAGAAVAIAGTVKTFGDLESGVTNVVTLLDSSEQAQFKDTLQTLAEEAVAAGFGIEDATKALFNNVSALGANEQAFGTFQAAQKLAIAGVADLNVAGAGIAAVMNAYKEEMLDANDVATAFFAAQKRGTTDVSKLASTVGTVAPFAKAAGVGFKELLATMAQVTQGGVSTEETATALKGVITALVNPTKDAKMVLDAFGIASSTSQLKQEGLVETLRKLNKLQKTNEDLLVRAVPNIRAFLGVATLTDEGLDTILKTMEEMNTSEAIDSAHTAQLQTFNMAMRQLKGAITIVASDIGKQLAPAITWLAQKIIAGAIAFKNMSDQMKKVIAWSLAVAAGISTVLGVIGTVMILLGKGAVVAGVVAAAFGAIPLAIVAGIALIAAAIASIYVNFDILKAKAGEVKESIKRFFGFGGDELDVNAKQEISQRSQADVNVTLNSPKNVVKSIDTKTSGKTPGLNVGVNMVTAQ